MRSQATAAGQSFGWVKSARTWFQGLSDAIFGVKTELGALIALVAALALAAKAFDMWITTSGEAREAAEEAGQEYEEQREKA